MDGKTSGRQRRFWEVFLGREFWEAFLGGGFDLAASERLDSLGHGGRTAWCVLMRRVMGCGACCVNCI